MNKNQLQKEGRQWVQEGIISQEQLDRIVNRYEQVNTSIVLISFAVLFVSIGILLFAFTDWTGVSAVIRIILLAIVMIALYISGYLLYEKDMQKYGISFIILGYIFFGATLFLLSYEYNAVFFTEYQFIIWALVGLGLVYLYRHPSLIAIGMLVVIVGQWFMIGGLSSFSWILLLIYFIGYFHFVFHFQNKWTNIVFSLGIISHIITITITYESEYYWFIPLFFIMYILSILIPKESLHHTLLYMSMIAIFILHMVEAIFFLDMANDYYLPLESSFIIFLSVVACLFIVILLITKAHFHWINLILFFPFVILPKPEIFILIAMFIVSLYWIIISYQKLIDDKIPLSMTIFIISTITAYIQFGWDTMNRSLFFIIGGILLFLISYVFERQRRKVEMRDSK